jgi:PAS domain S-box-containing protein
MKVPLRILQLEDDPRDAELVQEKLADGGFACEVTRVETEVDFAASLGEGGFGLILADYSLPSFDGLSALKLARQNCPDVPFIFVAGTLGEDVAIEALKIGATDYVSKTGLSRLASSVKRALREGQERKELSRAENGLRRSEAYLAEAQRLSHTGSFGWDVSSGEIYWSQETFRIFGYEPASRITVEQVLQRTHPEDRPAVQQFLERVSSERKNFDVEHRLLMPDRSVKHVRVVGHPSTDESGRLEFLGAITDITERKCADEELREQADLLDLTHDTVFVRDMNDVITYWNRGAEERYGWSSEEAVGRVSHELTQTSFPAPLRDMNAELLKTGRWEGELVHTRRDRTQVMVASRWALQRDESGNPAAILETNNDVTERRRAEALLAGENRLLEMVARGDSLPLILDALCRLVEELATGAVSSILLFEPSGNCLRHGAAPNLPQAYIDAIDGLVIGPVTGSCGTAAYRAEPVIVSDIANDPLWANYRDVALPYGLRACWSAPILSSEGKVLGTFAIYYREPRTPTAKQHEIIEQITHLASIALERKRAEEALRASEQVARGQVEAMAQSLDVLATAPAPDRFLGQMLSTIGRLLHAQSVVFWLLDDPNDSLVLRAAAEGVNFAAADPEHPFMKNPLSWKEDKVLQDAVFTGAPVICEDVEHDPRISPDVRDYFTAKGTRKWMTIPTLVGGHVRGFIGIRHGDRPVYQPEEIELAQALAHQAMLAIQLNQFAEQSRLAAVLEERNRMARDVHDTLAQGFTGVIVQLEAAEDATSCGHQKEANKHLHRAAGLARRSLNEARRSVHALRPDALKRDNFWEALKGIAKGTTAGTALHTSFQQRGKLPELPPVWQENLLHIGQEALTNTLKYAEANNFRARLSCNVKGVRLELADDGGGFELADRDGGLGLTGMRERVDQMNGQLEITSGHGKGTKVVVALPLHQEAML